MHNSQQLSSHLGYRTGVHTHKYNVGSLKLCTPNNELLSFANQTTCSHLQLRVIYFPMRRRFHHPRVMKLACPVYLPVWVWSNHVNCHRDSCPKRALVANVKIMLRVINIHLDKLCVITVYVYSSNLSMLSQFPYTTIHSMEDSEMRLLSAHGNILFLYWCRMVPTWLIGSEVCLDRFPRRVSRSSV